MIEHADSFDVYGTGSASFMLDGLYAQVPGHFSGDVIRDDPDGLSSQSVLLISGNPLRYPLRTPQDVIGSCLRMWLTTLPTTADAQPVPFVWSTIDNVNIARLVVQTNGAMALYVGTGDGVLHHTTSTPVVSPESWWHLEYKIDTTTGTFELRVEGEVVMDLAAVPFAVGDVFQISNTGEESNTGAKTDWYMKDFVVWNTTGTDNTDFLGLVRVENLRPDADDTDGAWTAVPTGDLYAVLDNNPPSDGAYVSAEVAAVGSPMRVAMDNLPDDVSAVKGLVSYVRARKTSGGVGDLQVSMIGTGGTAGAGADRPITAGYVYWRDTFERDPGTGVAWTRSGVNNALVKIDRTA